MSKVSYTIDTKHALIAAGKDVTSSLINTAIDFISKQIINFIDEEYIKTQLIDTKTLKHMVRKVNKTSHEIIDYVIDEIEAKRLQERIGLTVKNEILITFLNQIITNVLEYGGIRIPNKYIEVIRGGIINIITTIANGGDIKTAIVSASKYATLSMINIAIHILSNELNTLHYQ